MLKTRIITKLLLLIVFLVLPPTSSFALNIDEAIDLAIKNSLEVKIETKRTEFTGLSKFEAATDFLPNVSYNYRDGTRRTEVSSISEKQDDKAKSLDIKENLFNGFSGVSRFTEAVYQGKSADQNLNLKKNEIALQVADSYFNILRYRQIIAIDNLLIIDYKKLISLATQKLSLRDIGYNDFAEYVLKANKAQIDANQNKIALNKYETNFVHLTGQEPSDLSHFGADGNWYSSQYPYDDLIATSLSRNPKIKSTSFASSAKKAALFAESGKLLPTVSINFRYETEQSSYYFGNQELKNKSVYLNFAVPIFQSGVEYSGIAKANKERQIAELQKQLAVKEVEKAVQDEYKKYSSLGENLQSAKIAFEAGSKSLNLAKSRFEKKDIGMMDYLLQKVSNAEAQKQLISIKAEYMISYYNLKFLTDEITSKSH